MSTPTAPADSNLSHLAVLIPAWQPDSRLVSLVQELALFRFGIIVIVDDGSHGPGLAIFDELRARNISVPRISVFRHAVNLGKGRALKTAFNVILTGHPQIQGVITADADGQHTPADILRLAQAFVAELDSTSPRPILGSRRFNTRVPLRSRFGNTLTRQIFFFITGTRLSDTQTGLRAIPASLLPQLLSLEGERYEYETTVLLHLCRHPRLRPAELPIETIYLDANRSSHFNPIRDSMRIYFVLARFYASSLLAAAVDFLGFAAAFSATGNILASLIIGRLSSLLNFALNKRFVFHSRRALAPALRRYYALAAAIAALSYGLIWSLTCQAHFNVFIAKLCVDVPLSLISFSVQRTFIFRTAEQT
jgi:glycosyltransferase involved in cell wall biosynthesis